MTPDPLNALGGERLVPVVVIDDAGAAPDLASALAAGGIRCAEITLRTPAAVAAIEAASGVADFVVGAGTVTEPDQVDLVVDAGARFVVCPGLDEAVIERAARLGVPVIPGVATATEIQRAMRLGLRALKLFPAHLMGGPAAIRAFAGPFPDVRFLPSGGVSADNAREYLASPTVFAVSGSWMVPETALRTRDFGAVRDLSAAAVAALG